tara:strand:- start:261 stop:2021 length:1761 start_codon:yes stop_codon:yes gene_type:complete
MPYIGKSPEMGVRTRYYYTVSAGATSVSGSDDNSKSLTFSDGEFVDVSLNGVALVAGTDYNTTTANTIAGLSAMSANDVVEVVVYDVFSVFSGDISGDLAVGANLSVTGGATFTTPILNHPTGTENIGIGTGVFAAIEAGAQYNTALGSKAAAALTTGDYNTIIGRIAGDAMTTASLNDAFGYEALSSNTTGKRNVAMGVNSLKTLNHTDSTDAYNTAVGNNTGASMTTGLYNTLIGGLAGDALTDADANTAVGQNALSSDTLGSLSVAIGQGALAVQNFTSATNSFNIAVGYDAGKAVTTGIRNTLIGALAGGNLTTGIKNTFVGNLAGDGTDDGEHNTAVGMEALSSNCGDLNTAVGHNAGLNVTGGTNCIVGAGAGDSITSGSGNVVMGRHAGGGNLATGNNNICLGSGADTSAGDVSNAISIGIDVTAAANDFSFGKDSNVVTNDFDADANWSRSSDERLKKNITNQTLGLDFINDLRTVKYKWKANNELDASDSQLAHLYKKDAADNEMNTDAVMHNFIAQEVKAALDTAGVSDFGGWKEDQYGVQQVSREMFVIPLVKAVQELSTALDAAVARIKTLEDG